MTTVQRAQFPLSVSNEFYQRQNNPKYFFHHERWNQKPGLHADIDDTDESVRMIVGNNWGVSGSAGVASSDVAHNGAGGGIKLETQATNHDMVFVQPNTTSGVCGWASLQFNTAKQPYMFADIVTGDAITFRMMMFGYTESTMTTTETTTDALVADSNDSFHIMSSTEGLTSLTNWNAVSTRTNGAATETDTGITIVASTRYRLEMWLDKDRKPHYYINGAEVATADTTALIAVTDLQPVIGIQSYGTTEPDFVCLSLAISQLYN